MTSISSLAFFIFLILIIPVSINKIAYENVFPLIKHKFSLPLEIKQFYVPVILIEILCALVFQIWTKINYPLLDAIIFGKDLATKYSPTIKEVFNGPNLLYFIIVYLLCYFLGRANAKAFLNKIRKHIKDEKPLFELKDITLFGIWSAIIYSREEKVVFNLDILTDGDLLYSGELYHYDLAEDGLQTVTLKNTKRFLVSIDKVQGKNEKKYSIPGELTHFVASKVKNINIRSIVGSSDGSVFWGEKIKGSLETNKKFVELLQKDYERLIKEVTEKTSESSTKTPQKKQSSKKNSPNT